MFSLGLSSDFVRKLSSSKFNYWAGYAANLSLVVWLLSRPFAVQSHDFTHLTMGGWLFYAIVGAFVWTFAEYILHRYMYHEVHSALSVGHDMHHKEPKALLGVPWYLTTIVLVAVYYLLALVTNPARTAVVMAFTWLGYIGYCAIHHSIHHFNFKNAWFQNLRKHHFIHHARHDSNWGITTDFWDKVFRTKFHKL